jgi:hypothetical protein
MADYAGLDYSGFDVTSGTSSPFAAIDYHLTFAAPTGGTTYLMRATDTSLATTVYWSATSIDGGGEQYTGPGPLTNIVWMGP